MPGVPSGASQAGTVASGQGVAGSQAAIGATGGSLAYTCSNTNGPTNGVGVTSCECKFEVILYRELQQLPLTDLPHLGPVAREAYQKALAEGLVLPHSRLDIVWQPMMK